jgi:hypothetical protein
MQQGDNLLRKVFIINLILFFFFSLFCYPKRNFEKSWLRPSQEILYEDETLPQVAKTTLD